MELDKHTKYPVQHPAIVAAVLGVTLAGLGFASVFQYGNSLDAILSREGPKGVPIPFVHSTNDGFSASLVQIGQTGSGGSIPVFLAELSDQNPEDTQEQLSDDAIYLVRTGSVSETVPFDWAFETASGQILDYFLYKYSDGEATQEIANKNAATFAERFPGTFAASTEAWANEAEHGNALSLFSQANNVTFLPTHAGSGITFEANALYALVVNEPGGGIIDAEPTVTCGDGWKAAIEQCDDGNLIDGDGCSMTCTIESVSSSSESSTGTGSSSVSSSESSESSSSTGTGSSSVSSSSSTGTGSSSVSSSSSSDSSESSSSSEQTWDIALHHDESPVKYFGPAADDFERGDILRQAVSEMQIGDTLILSAARFDIDCKNKGNLRFPNDIAVAGQGMDQTHVFGDCYSDMQGSAFEVRNGHYSDMTFENKSHEIYEDGRTVDMYNGYKRTADNVNYLRDENGDIVIDEVNPGPFRVHFDRMRLKGTAWVTYTWNYRNNVWIIRDSEVVSGRQGLSFMSSGGANSQSGYILRTKIIIDTMLSRDIGWTSNRTHGGGYGVVVRSGYVKVEDSEFHMKCGDSPHASSFVPRCAGVFDGYGFGSVSSSSTWITLVNNRWYIDGDFYGNESPDTADIWMANTGAILKLRIEGGCGSGSGCEIIKRGASGPFYQQ